jgi:hypothetical protein
MATPAVRSLAAGDMEYRLGYFNIKRNGRASSRWVWDSSPEPATSILREFSLDVIGQYFPSCPAEIGARLGGSDSCRPR